MSFASLPLDILLVILWDLSIADVVRIGMTSKDLHDSTEDRHVWIDQLEKLRREDPVLRSATSPLVSLSVQELKTFVTGWAKLRLRWDKDGGENDFAAKGLAEFPGVEELRLLPGGKSVLVIGGSEVTLCRIKLEDGQLSLPVVSTFPCDQATIGWSELLIAMSPCPILTHRQGENIHLIRVDHYNATMSLETTFPIPEGYGFVRARGQGRVVGFLIKRHGGLPRAVVTHLDYPGVSMESDVSPVYAVDSRFPWSICIPSENLVIIYNFRHILAYEIPDFAGLPSGVSRSGVGPVRYWPGPDPAAGIALAASAYMTGEALCDPPSAQGFNLHYVCEKHAAGVDPFAATIKIPMNIQDGLAPESTESPEFERRSTLIRSHGWRSVRFFGRKGLHSDITIYDNKADILVTSLNDLGREGRGKALHMIASFEGFHGWESIGMDMDEATGRVVIWGWDKVRDQAGPGIFVGDLV